MLTTLGIAFVSRRARICFDTVIVILFVAFLCSVVGLYLFYYAAVASGAAIVLIATLVFIVTLLVSPRRRMLRMTPACDATDREVTSPARPS